MRPDAPIADLVGKARVGSGTVRKAITALIGAHRDARELFLADDGEMKPAAKRLFAMLAKEARLDRLGEFQPDARLQDQLIGRQYIVRRMAAMLDLDVTKLEHLQRQAGGEK